MKLVFIDETSDSKFTKYLGLSCIVIDCAFYRGIKEEFQKILNESCWPKDVEFKGSYIFSASQGDKNVTVEERVNITRKILELNAKKNAKVKFYYIYDDNAENHKASYLSLLPLLLEKALSIAQTKQGKDVLCVHYDQRNDINSREVYDAIIPVVKKKKFILLENVCSSNSCYHTVGILYADLAGYLLSRIETVEMDSELFENIPPEEWEKNGKIRKYKSSKKLLALIKKKDVYKVISSKK